MTRFEHYLAFDRARLPSKADQNKGVGSLFRSHCLGHGASLFLQRDAIRDSADAHWAVVGLLLLEEIVQGAMRVVCAP